MGVPWVETRSLVSWLNSIASLHISDFMSLGQTALGYLSNLGQITAHPKALLSFPGCNWGCLCVLRGRGLLASSEALSFPGAEREQFITGQTRKVKVAAGPSLAFSWRPLLILPSTACPQALLFRQGRAAYTPTHPVISNLTGPSLREEFAFFGGPEERAKLNPMG